MASGDCTVKITKAELLEVYRIALLRVGSYSTIRIDAVTRWEWEEIAVYYSVPYIKNGEEQLIFQGYHKEFKVSGS